MPDGRRPRLGTSVMGIWTLVIAAAAGAVAEDSASDDPGPPGFAVVELFTSEGCSSCPRADKVLSRLIEQADRKGLPVYCLSFHVDYWNRLGWTDPFSRPAFTRRQRDYARARGTGRVYTPQMIVNGQDEFVGSRGTTAIRSINLALRESTGAAVELGVEPLAGETGRDGESLRVRCRTTGVTHPAVVHVALVERGLSREVTRGENTGRTLEHDNVVRVFETAEPDASNSVTATLTLPAEADPAKASVIVYVQEKGSRAIIAAASESVPTETADGDE